MIFSGYIIDIPLFNSSFPVWQGLSKLTGSDTMSYLKFSLFVVLCFAFLYQFEAKPALSDEALSELINLEKAILKRRLSLVARQEGDGPADQNGSSEETPSGPNAGEPGEGQPQPGAGEGQPQPGAGEGQSEPGAGEGAGEGQPQPGADEGQPQPGAGEGQPQPGAGEGQSQNGAGEGQSEPGAGEGQQQPEPSESQQQTGPGKASASNLQKIGESFGDVEAVLTLVHGHIKKGEYDEAALAVQQYKSYLSQLELLIEYKLDAALKEAHGLIKKAVDAHWNEVSIT